MMKKSGFTLVELSVVITLVFLLAFSGGGVQLLRLIDRRAEFQIRAQAMRQIATGLDWMSRQAEEHGGWRTDGNGIRFGTAPDAPGLQARNGHLYILQGANGSGEQLLLSACQAGRLAASFDLHSAEGPDGRVEIEARIYDRKTAENLKTIKATTWIPRL